MTTIIVFGGSGDLAKRKIMPALEKVADKDDKVFAYARSNLSDNYPGYLREYHEYTTDFPDRVKYIVGKYSNLAPIESIVNTDTIYYFAVPPEIYPVLFENIKTFPRGSVCIEKPFGNDTASFSVLKQYTEYSQCFIDHYLLKPLIRIAPILLVQNRPLRHMLSRDHVKAVIGSFHETITAEGRQYFDQTGIIKDVIQNHLLVSLATVISRYDDHCNGSNVEECAGRRLEAIKSMKILKNQIILGQYENYPQEMGHETSTETYAMIPLEIKDPRWENVPFILSAGKALEKKCTEISFLIKRESYEEILGVFDAAPKIDAHIVKEMRLVFNIAPDNEIYVHIEEPDRSRKIIVYFSTAINKYLKDRSGNVFVDHELVFWSLMRSQKFNSSKAEEIGELWNMFEEVFKDTKHYVKPRKSSSKSAASQSKDDVIKSNGDASKSKDDVNKSSGVVTNKSNDNPIKLAVYKKYVEMPKEAQEYIDSASK